jgi:hypothetical protein
MQKVTKVKLVVAISRPALEDKINEALKEGWQPYDLPYKFLSQVSLQEPYCAPMAMFEKEPDI